MKKNKLLCVVLILTVAFTMVFASSGSVFAAQTTYGTGIIEAVDINTIKETNDVAYMTYSSSTPDSVLINMPTTGTISLCVQVTEASTASLYDAAGNLVYGYGYSFEPSVTTTDFKYAYFPVSAAGTYKLVMQTYSSNQVQATVGAFRYPNGGTPEMGTMYYGSSPNEQVSLYKVEATGNGYITVDFTGRVTDYATYDVMLFTASKKAAFKNGYEYISSSKEYKTRIGVAKGTYYIGVKTSDPCYGLTLKFTKVAEKSGSKKSKAVKLSKGKTKKGIITATQSSKSGDWYKFTISKSQKVTLDVSTLTSPGGNYGGLKISLYKGKSSKPFGTQSIYYNAPNHQLSPYTIGLGGNRLQKGTYYIKVQKINEGNGYYKIKWR